MNKTPRDTKYLIYARKSSESDEKQVQSIDDQLRVMQDMARDLGLTVVDTLSEARSAKEPHTRSVFEELVRKIQTGEADGILTWKIDRLSRNPIDSATIQWLLQQGKVKSIQTVGREYLPEDNSVIFSVESSMANQYIRDLSKNVKRGLKSKLEKGIAPKLAPLGYLNTKTEARGENFIVKDPERFHIVRKAWGMMLTGNHSGPAILDILNSEYGLRTRKTRRQGGRPLSRSGLYRMFNDPFYAGQFRYNGTLYEGVHEPMVTKEEFDRVQAILGRPGKPKQNRHAYVYTGLLHCGECGGPISATYKEKTIKATGERKAYALYYCIPARKCTRPCSQRRYINGDAIDEQVKAEIESFTIRPAFRDWALDIADEEEITECADVEKISVSLQSAIDDAERQLDKLIDMCARELLSEEEYKAKRTELVSTIATLKANRRSTDARLSERRQNIERALHFATDALLTFENGSVEDKRGVFSTMRLNSTLEGKKLALQTCFWLTRIKEQYPPIERQRQVLERRFGRGTEPYKKALVPLVPSVRALMDAIGADVDRGTVPQTDRNGSVELFSGNEFGKT